MSDIKIYPVSTSTDHIMEHDIETSCNSEENMNVSSDQNLKRKILGDILVFPHVQIHQIKEKGIHIFPVY